MKKLSPKAIGILTTIVALFASGGAFSRAAW